MHQIKDFWEDKWLKNSVRYPSLRPTNDLPWELNNHDPHLPYITEVVSNKSGKMIDIGCGTGHDTKFFKDHGYDSLGIDISETAIEIAKSNFKDVDFQCKDILNDKFDSDFNLIYDKGCLHNFQQNGVMQDTIVSTIFLKFYNMLNKNGEVVLITGNKNEVGDLRTTHASKMQISDVEKTCYPMFNIKFVQEIVFAQNENYGDSLGWLFLLGRR